jgi:hypothetical protein
MHLRSRENRETLPFTEAVRRRPLYLDTSSYLKQIDVYRAPRSSDAASGSSTSTPTFPSRRMRRRAT